ncbi:MAG: glycosyltransferase [Acidobacteriia bacterium]|nr:glycosyltransferase [Terriglobia bacterium]
MNQPDNLEQRQLPSISVVICCHNSASRLPETLRHLAAQQQLDGLDWAILVIDNASTDGTTTVCSEFAVAHPRLSIRCVLESRLGQAYARLRGLMEARGDVILFVDDDNWLDPDYLAIVAHTMAAHPEIAILGGTSSAVCEQEPPAWFPRHQRWYAVSGPSQGTQALTEVGFVWGAGSAYRRGTLERATATPLRIPGRQGEALHAGDDDELCWLARLTGDRMFIHTQLHFRHYLPARRLSWDYLRKLNRSAGEVSVSLDAYRLEHGQSVWPRWLLQSWHAQLLNAYWRLLHHPVLWWRATREPLEGDDRVLRWEKYCGRLAALKNDRKVGV